MDLRLYFRVLGRFKYLVLTGLFLAVALTFISFFRVSVGDEWKLSYRQSETWQSTEALLLTQKGFPWGRTVFPYNLSQNGGQPVYSTPFADPTRFSGLAVFYSKLANSDPVRKLARKNDGPILGTYFAYPLTDNSGNGRSPLPFVAIDGYATSPAGAVRVARRISEAFQIYLKRNQVAAGIAPRLRVLVETSSRANEATLANGRRLTIPVVLFLTILIATIGLAFILENLFPSVRPVAGGREDVSELASASRGAGSSSA